MNTRLINSKRGFTLVEVLIAMAIMAILAGGVATTIYQIFAINAQSNNAMLVIRQVQTLGQWLNKDVQMAQVTDPGDTDGFPLILEWDYRDFSDGSYTGQAHTITYTYDSATGIIERENTLYSSTPDDDTIVSTTTITVAEYIDTVTFTGNTLEVTASKDGQSETRNYEINNRVTQS